MKGQGEKERQARLKKGQCPIHGLGLCQVGISHDQSGLVGDVVSCPRNGCKFSMTVRPADALWKVLHS
jgi:hypothetical protein